MKTLAVPRGVLLRVAILAVVGGVLLTAGLLVPDSSPIPAYSELTRAEILKAGAVSLVLPDDDPKIGRLTAAGIASTSVGGRQEVLGISLARRGSLGLVWIVSLDPTGWSTPEPPEPPTGPFRQPGIILLGSPSFHPNSILVIIDASTGDFIRATAFGLGFRWDTYDPL